MHSSNYEVSQPEIFSDHDQNNDLKIRRVETSDNLEVSEEHQQKQFVDFSQAKTHLYDFQVRKSPVRHAIEGDDGPPCFLQIPSDI